MRVNIYAEEMTDRVEIISKTIGGNKFTGLRLYLEMPASYVYDADGKAVPATASDGVVKQMKSPFYHTFGDDDSSAITFWGKRDLRQVLLQMLAKLDEHYTANPPARGSLSTDHLSHMAPR